MKAIRVGLAVTALALFALVVSGGAAAVAEPPGVPVGSG